MCSKKKKSGTHAVSIQCKMLLWITIQFCPCVVCSLLVGCKSQWFDCHDQMLALPSAPLTTYIAQRLQSKRGKKRCEKKQEHKLNFLRWRWDFKLCCRRCCVCMLVCIQEWYWGKKSVIKILRFEEDKYSYEMVSENNLRDFYTDMIYK